MELGNIIPDLYPQTAQHSAGLIRYNIELWRLDMGKQARKAKVVGHISHSVIYKEPKNIRLLNSFREQAKWWKEVYNEPLSPQEAFSCLQDWKEQVDTWRASDGGLTWAAGDSLSVISWCENLIQEMISMKKTEIAELCYDLDRVNREADLDPGYRTCYERECYSLLRRVGWFLVL